MEDRKHLPPAPLGYRWETTIELAKGSEHGHASVNLVPTSWEHLNPHQSRGFGLASRPGESAEEVYQRLVAFAWIGHDVEANLDRRREELYRKMGWER